MSDPGGVRCWVTCDPYKPKQIKVVPDNDKLSSCINACTGSFEKAKRAAETGLDVSKRQDEYWVCHAVNFIEVAGYILDLELARVLQRGRQLLEAIYPGLHELMEDG
ncbi:hypothetical protein F4824DRAFT_501069 [Ustulina deusta]|nr:hypothetical protein F4824DRAFT_501069 [Ustulina deusta]